MTVTAAPPKRRIVLHLYDEVLGN